MIHYLRAATVRLAMVTGPRALVVMGGVGGAAGFGSQVIDLTGQLPVDMKRSYLLRPVERIEGMVWHHSATNGQTIKSIADYHVQVRKWPAIAYHYAIGYDGRAYKLNDVDRITYHAEGRNSKTIGVVLIGNYQERELTEAMKATAVKMEEYLSAEYHLKYVWLHRETKATACPGRYATDFLDPLLFGPRP